MNNFKSSSLKKGKSLEEKIKSSIQKMKDNFMTNVKSISKKKKPRK